MKIGVFDSGIGGTAIAEALRNEFPAANVIVVDDSGNIPYGSKPASTVRRLTEAAIQPLIEADCDIIIIACNTATTASISYLRQAYPEQFFIGIEPMIKTAALRTKTGIVAVCATPGTLGSARYKELKKTFGPELDYLEPDCSDWARLIQDNSLNEARIDAVIDSITASEADVIVLGCTHYHWIKEVITDKVGPAITVLEPSEAIGRRVRELLKL